MQAVDQNHSVSQVYQFDDLHEDNRIHMDVQQIVDQKLAELQLQGETHSANKEHGEYLQLLKKQILMDKSSLLNLKRYGDTLHQMGDLKGAVRFYYNI